MKLKIPDIGTFEDEEIRTYEGVGWFVWPDNTSLDDALKVNKFWADPLMEVGDPFPILTLYERVQPPAYLIQVSVHGSLSYVGSQTLTGALKLMAELSPLVTAIELAGWKRKVDEIVDRAIAKVR